MKRHLGKYALLCFGVFPVFLLSCTDADPQGGESGQNAAEKVEETSSLSGPEGGINRIARAIVASSVKTEEGLKHYTGLIAALPGVPRGEESGRFERSFLAIFPRESHPDGGFRSVRVAKNRGDLLDTTVSIERLKEIPESVFQLFEYSSREEVFAAEVPDQTLPLSEGTKVILISATSAKGDSGEVADSGQAIDSFSIEQTRAVVASVDERGNAEVEITDGKNPPPGASHVAVSEEGEILGIVSSDGEVDYQLHQLSDLAGVALPAFDSVTFSLEDRNSRKDSVKILMEVEGSFGIGWTGLNSVIVPAEELEMTPSEGDVSSIFHPEREPTLFYSERLSALSSEAKLSFREGITLLPGEEASFVGQLFVENASLARVYFEPFRFSLHRSRSGQVYSYRFEPHSIVSVKENGLEEILGEEYEAATKTAFSEPVSLPYNGNLVRLLLAGSREEMILHTDEEPFFYRVEISEKTIRPDEIFGGLVDQENLQIAIGGEFVFLLDASAGKVEKRSMETGEVMATRQLDQPAEALAVGSSSESSPVMVATESGVEMFRQSDLSPIPAKFGPRHAQEEDIEESFEFTREVYETGKVVSEASADGASFFFRVFANYALNSVSETVLFRPLEEHAYILYQRQARLLDLGFNGDLLYGLNPSSRNGVLSVPRGVKGAFLCTNRGGDGFFSLEGLDRYSSMIMPSPPAAVHYYLPGESEPAFSAVGLPELGMIEKSYEFPSVLYLPDGNTLVVAPSAGRELVLRTLLSEVELESSIRVTGAGKLSVDRGMEFTHQLTLIGDPASVRLENAPPGTEFDLQSRLLSLKISEDYPRDMAQCKLIFENESGAITTHEIEIEVRGEHPSVLSSENPWTRSSQNEGEAKALGILGQTIPFAEPVSDIVPTDGGRKLAVLTGFDARLQLVDLSRFEVVASTRLPGDSVMVCANQDAVFCYYPFHRMVERRSTTDLSIEKRVRLPSESTLYRFDAAHSADDNAPIVCVEQKPKADGKARYRFIDPVNLSFLSRELEEDFERASGFRIPNTSVANHHFHLSECGTRILLENNVVSFDKHSAKPAGGFQGDIYSKVSFSGNRDAVISSNIQLQLGVGTEIDRTTNGQDFYRFGFDGEWVVGFTFFTENSRPRASHVRFYRPGSSRPNLYLHALSEFDGKVDNSRLTEGYPLVGKTERVFYSSSAKRLVTVPWNNRSIVIREVDPEQALDQMK